MTVRAAKFTPEVLLSAPRRSEGSPNSDASKVLYSVSTYSFEEHSKKSEIRILDVASQQTSLLTDDKTASEPVWIDDDNILLLKSGDEGVTTVLIGKAENFGNEQVDAYDCSCIPSLTSLQQLHRWHYWRSYWRS